MQVLYVTDVLPEDVRTISTRYLQYLATLNVTLFVLTFVNILALASDDLSITMMLWHCGYGNGMGKLPQQVRRVIPQLIFDLDERGVLS